MSQTANGFNLMGSGARAARLASRQISKSTARLASGLRIRGGSDDVGGLGMAARISARVRSLNQAIRKTQDAFSLVNTAEQGLSGTVDLLLRARELAIQAANDTATATDRLGMQIEFEALVSQMDLVALHTRFNTMALLDGTFQNKTFGLGTKGLSGTDFIQLSIDNMRPLALGSTTTSSTSIPGSAIVVSSQDVDGNPIGPGDLTLNAAAIADSLLADDTFSSQDADASAIAKAAAINKSTGTHGVTATILATNVTAPNQVAAGNIKDRDLKINGVKLGTINSILANDSSGVPVAAIDAFQGSTGVTASVSGGYLTLTAADGRNIEVDIKGTGTLSGFVNGNNQISYGRRTLAATVDITVGGTSPLERIGIAVGVTLSNASTTTTTVVDAVADASGATKAAANDALAVIDAGLQQVLDTQAQLGALSNRFIIGSSHLTTQSVNLSIGFTRIAGTDFARESAELIKSKLRESVAFSRIALGNADPGRVLDLISLGAESLDLPSSL